jgi:hypothetical protein
MASDDVKGKGKVADKKEMINNKSKGDKPVDSGLNNKKKDGKKKCIKKIIYYDNDTSHLHQRTMTPLLQRKIQSNKNYSKMSSNYSRIPYNSNTHLLSIPYASLLSMMGSVGGRISTTGWKSAHALVLRRGVGLGVFMALQMDARTQGFRAI